MRGDRSRESGAAGVMAMAIAMVALGGVAEATLPVHKVCEECFGIVLPAGSGVFERVPYYREQLYMRDSGRMYGEDLKRSAEARVAEAERANRLRVNPDRECPIESPVDLQAERRRIALDMLGMRICSGIYGGDGGRPDPGRNGQQTRADQGGDPMHTIYSLAERIEYDLVRMSSCVCGRGGSDSRRPTAAAAVTVDPTKAERFLNAALPVSVCDEICERMGVRLTMADAGSGRRSLPHETPTFSPEDTLAVDQGHTSQERAHINSGMGEDYRSVGWMGNPAVSRANHPHIHRSLTSNLPVGTRILLSPRRFV